MVSKSQSKEFWRYAWDYENRMMTASTRKQTVRYRYDALGRRIQRYLVGGKENTKFIYDGLDVVADDNSGVLTKYQNGLGIDNKLKLTSGGVSKYFLQDHLGSTVGLTDASGNISSSASYNSFGNETGNLSTRYQYTGREYDNFTGLQYSRARWYDANLGRFISEDPIGFRGGDINLYGYVHNNSVNKKDPLGLIDPIVFQNPDIYDSYQFDPYKNVAPKNQKCSCETENPEISKMKDMFQREVEDMTRRGQRLNNGVLTNLGATGAYVYNSGGIIPYYYPATPYLGCGQQADEINIRLADKLDKKWHLEIQGGYYYGFPHQFSVGYSSDPNDPIVILDPWDNNFETRRRR
jgi:RHS repeat-associated protein